MPSPDVAATANRLRANVSRVIVGKEAAIDLVLVALLCEGHVLIEDVPGTGKTMLAKAVARSLDCTFKRIQFTPDLLPSDITGVKYFNQRTQDFVFQEGPIFSQIVLADEINRATPRTQSALLEAMEERQVTVEGETMPLPRPLLVLATQNPIELEGTFPLPEAQLDRFFVRVTSIYPTREEEKLILRRFRERNALLDLEPVSTGEELLALSAACRGVAVNPDIEDYIVRLTQKTREHEAISLGASPRASLALYHAAQALAAIRGRDFVLPDDVKALASPVLEHRLIPSASTRLRGRSTADIMREVLETVPVPVEVDAALQPL